MGTPLWSVRAFAGWGLRVEDLIQNLPVQGVLYFRAFWAGLGWLGQWLGRRECCLWWSAWLVSAWAGSLWLVPLELGFP